MLSNSKIITSFSSKIPLNKYNQAILSTKWNHCLLSLRENSKFLSSIQNTTPKHIEYQQNRFYSANYQNNNYQTNKMSCSNITFQQTMTQTSSYSTQKHAIVATTHNDKTLSCQLKDQNVLSSQSTFFKYIPFTPQKSGQTTSQSKICIDDPYDQIHYLCIDEPSSKDIHFYQQFSDVLVDGDEFHLSYRKLGENLMKSIIGSYVPPKSKNVNSEDENKSEYGSIEVFVDSTLASNQAFVEGLFIGNYNFKKFYKSYSNFKEFPYVKISPIEENKDSNLKLKSEKTIELAATHAKAELLARFLMDIPSNLKTPVKISEIIQDEFSEFKDFVQVQVHDKTWIENQKMGSFLSVSQGSAQEPRVVEIFYNGDKTTEETTIQFVGKGITFDTGGISLKPAKGMKDMRGDMGGAATAIATMKALAILKPKINVRATAFFCENMPGGKATKPGDVFVAMNGKTIEVDNTDAEGRLILADAIYYSTKTYNPKYVVNLATLTGAIVVALGSVASGTYSTHNSFWKKLEKAGFEAEDYLWRMPLFSKFFTTERMKSNLADLCNVSSVAEAGSCSAAAFLTEFIHFNEDKSRPHFAHIDIAGTAMESSKMTGRPTRTLIQLVKNISEESN